MGGSSHIKVEAISGRDPERSRRGPAAEILRSGRISPCGYKVLFTGDERHYLVKLLCV